MHRSIRSLSLAATAFLFVLTGTVAAQPYTLNIARDPVEGGTYQVDATADVYVQGTVITVYAVPLAGYRFVGWEGDIAASESPLIFEITADTSLTAVFEAFPEADTEFAVQTAVEPPDVGYVMLDPVQETYGLGEAVTLYAVPTAGYVFSGWTGDVPAGADPHNAELPLILSKDVNITAAFEIAAEVTPDATTSAGKACGAAGMLFWPLTAAGLVALRRR
jgi:hypothetical protein